MKTVLKIIGVFLIQLLLTRLAHAELTSDGVMDQVIGQFATRASAWQAIIMGAASWLFWTLGTISLVMTFGFMALRKADIGEFFAEFISFILFFGFFLWLLRNGPRFALDIMDSLSLIGRKASGGTLTTPSGVVDLGFFIWKQALDNLSIWSPVDSFLGLLLSISILVLLTSVAVNMLLLYISGWVLAYGGMIFLGFGGSRWTSDMSINYYRTVFSVGIQLMTMILLVGVANDLLSSFYEKMGMGANNFAELSVMLVLCITLHLLTSRLPSIVAGIATGASINSSAGVGSFGTGAVAGAAMGAYGMASASASMAGSMAMQGASSAANGAQALMNAIAEGQASAGAAPNPLAGLFENRAEQAARITAALMKSKSPDGRMSGSSGGIGGSGGNRKAGSASGGSFSAGGQSGSNKAAASGKSISGGGSSGRGSQGVTSGSSASSGASGSGTSTGGGGAYSGSTGSASHSGFASGGSGYGGFSSGNEYLGRPPDLPEPSRHHDADIAESIAAFTSANGSLSFEGDNYPKLPADFDYDGFFADRKSDPIAERIVRMNKPSWYYISGVDFSKFPKAPQ